MKQIQIDFDSKLTKQQAEEAMHKYADAHAEYVRHKTLLAQEIAKKENAVQSLLTKQELIMAEQEAILKSYAEQNVTEDKKSIKLPTGTIGFKQDPASVVIPKENEEAIINLMRGNDTMNTYVKVKTVLSLNKELIIQNKDEDEVKDKWKDFMITIKQDDRFFIKLK